MVERARLCDFLPNRLGKPMAFVVMNEGRPLLGAWQRFDAWQIFGGRRWTLSVIRVHGIEHPAPAPVPTTNEGDTDARNE